MTNLRQKVRQFFCRHEKRVNSYHTLDLWLGPRLEVQPSHTVGVFVMICTKCRKFWVVTTELKPKGNCS